MAMRFLEVEEIQDLVGVEQTKFFFSDEDADEDADEEKEIEKVPDTGRGGKADA